MSLHQELEKIHQNVLSSIPEAGRIFDADTEGEAYGLA